MEGFLWGGGWAERAEEGVCGLRVVAVDDMVDMG